eukprot:TRINITY_DN1347_c0_g2_i1.p1 TRINITY_DN1347_c0_g2~~TRINITY_DN1347_c0_g2_i1.p1  ORF type:complete len:196 (-),score=40.96 TRINITY_DN1347_c0_g2_i1:69-656(-)
MMSRSLFTVACVLLCASVVVGQYSVKTQYAGENCPGAARLEEYELESCNATATCVYDVDDNVSSTLKCATSFPTQPANTIRLIGYPSETGCTGTPTYVGDTYLGIENCLDGSYTVCPKSGGGVVKYNCDDKACTRGCEPIESRLTTCNAFLQSSLICCDANNTCRSTPYGSSSSSVRASSAIVLILAALAMIVMF